MRTNDSLPKVANLGTPQDPFSANDSSHRFLKPCNKDHFDCAVHILTPSLKSIQGHHFCASTFPDRQTAADQWGLLPFSESTGHIFILDPFKSRSIVHTKALWATRQHAISKDETGDL